VRRRNREKVLRGRDVLCAALDVPRPAPDELIGSLAAVPLPDGVGPSPTSSLYADPLQEALVEEERIEVPIVPFPAWPRRLVRISGQLYVEPAWYDRLAVALRRRAG
jgi:isopenicillin-N epimerase